MLCLFCSAGRAAPSVTAWMAAAVLARRRRFCLSSSPGHLACRPRLGPAPGLIRKHGLPQRGHPADNILVGARPLRRRQGQHLDGEQPNRMQQSIIERPVLDQAAFGAQLLCQRLMGIGQFQAAAEVAQEHCIAQSRS